MQIDFSIRILYNPMMANEAQKKWSNEQIEMLIILRNSTEWDKRFSDAKGKAKQTGDVWTELVREISAELTGVEARVEYNYLLNQFKKHKLIADKSGEGSVRWKHYLTFKDCLLRTPAVTPICTADSARFENPVIFDSLSDFENSDLSIRSDSSASKAKHKKKESYETKMLNIMEARNNVITSILTNKSDSGKKTDEKIEAIQTDIKSLNDKIDLLFQKLMKDDKK
ncbi:hypothetical protein ENBRE01_2562 [Enteropsectra breve]|nr:hypothetical protein ENBRE01_2562 [Enteropsectra breve]